MQLYPATVHRLVLVEDVSVLDGRELWPAWDARSLQLREFLWRYIARLDERRQELLMALLAGESERQLAARLGVNPSTAWRVTERAVRALVREMALDDPNFREWDKARRRGIRGSVPRDYDAEREAASRVFERFLASLVHQAA